MGLLLANKFIQALDYEEGKLKRVWKYYYEYN
jgi:hypothetical protein